MVRAPSQSKNGPRQSKNAPRGLAYDLKKNKTLLVMSIPALLFLIAFRYLPMYGVIVAFQKYSPFLGITRSPFVGMEQFQSFFRDPFFTRIIRNTFLLGLYSVLWTFPMPILLAVMLNEVRSNWFKRTTQTISYMPYFISTVIVVGLIKIMFASEDGIVNIARAALGMEKLAFLNMPRYFRSFYIGSSLWQGIGYDSIIYLAAITGIDTQLYEAAYIDGASRFKCIYHITIPSILPTIAVLLVMRIGNLLGVGFEKIFLLYSPATYETADVISTYVYRRAFTEINYSYASAVGLFNSVISTVLLISANTFSRKFLHESLW